MGNRFSRQHEGVEDIDASSNPYRYPPLSGKSYFADYFLMGGSRFDTPQPEAYLFGENSDLNLLNPKPVSFPYPQPPSNEPTKTLRSLVNLRKDSLKLVKSSDQESYSVEFVFDSDVKCAVTVHYRATEDLSTGLAMSGLTCMEAQRVHYFSYTSMEPLVSSSKTHFPKGSGQVYNSAPKHKVKPSMFTEEELNYCPINHSHIPVVIQIDADEEEYLGHSNITLATFEKMSDGSYIIKPIKQKQMVDGLCYLLQEIYGIENKINQKSGKDEDNEFEETGLECVICMSDMRDTLILPCRHLCLCRDCAESLRYQASNCPICRSPFHALLQVSAFIKKQNGSTAQESAWPGYEEIPLVEALNGTIKPDNIPEEAVARMRRRSASSVRSSGRKRVESARSHRYVERSLSACSGMSRPGTAPASRSRIEQAEEPARFEPVGRQEASLETKDMVMPIGGAEIEEATSVHEEEQASPVFTGEPEQDEDAHDLQVQVDVSLPGTPLSSDISGRSSLSAGSVSATTPTYIRLEESTGEATVTTIPT